MSLGVCRERVGSGKPPTPWRAARSASVEGGFGRQEEGLFEGERAAAIAQRLFRKAAGRPDQEVSAGTERPSPSGSADQTASWKERSTSTPEASAAMKREPATGSPYA